MTLADSALDLLHRRPGRRRIANRRPNAERDHRRVEPEHIIKAVVMAQRIRSVGPADAADPLAGHCLGRLYLNGKRCSSDPQSILEPQYQAGTRYAALANRHARLMGYSTGSPRSAILGMIGGGGLSCSAEPDEAVILECRRNWSDAYRVLMDAGRELGRGPFVGTATYDICLDRIDFDALDSRRIGDLRIGLNALCRLWR